MPDIAHDLLLLITNLSQQKEKQNILSLFVQGMNTLFPNVAFTWMEGDSSPDQVVFEVQTRNYLFGHLVVAPTHPISEEERSLIQNSVQMVAVILERIGHETELKVYKYDLEKLVETKTHNLVLREIKFRNLFESMAQGVVYQDAEGKITSTNSSAERILGLSLEQMQGLTSADPRWHAIHEDGSPFPGNEHPSIVALKTGKEVNNVLMGVFNYALESYTWINIHAVPQFRLGEEKPYEVFTTFEDVTSRKQNFELLERSEALYHDLVETSQDLIWQCDSKARYTYLNPAWEEVFGYKTEEMLGKTFTDFQSPEYAARDLKEFERLLQGDVVKGLETVHIGKGGNEIHLVFNAKYVRNEERKIVGTRGTAYDNTERRKMEIMLAERNLVIEQQVIDRTAELEFANKELEAFAYSISHDLRAPLRAIEGFSAILLERYRENLDAEGQRFLDIVRRSTMKMDTLITDLLDLSRVSRREIRLSPVRMQEMAESVYQEIASPTEKEEVDLVIGQLPHCTADELLIRQVWVNILSNALKYTGKLKKRSISIGARTEMDNNITYWVKDNGVGFDNKYTEKIFGVFQRLHTDNEFEGTGVGLAIVDRIIKHHHGKVWAEGEPGKGATFYFSLPALTKDEKGK
ncbi:MAG: PAS domain S-box protein [Bacteroidales bacterium]|nr:PAS domain S-box protein [Bacteroidales bacterium]